MKGKRISYSEAELLWIRGHRDWPRKQAHAAFVERFGRTDVSLENFKSLCSRKGWLTGRDGRIPKGNVPANKGRKGYYAPGCEKGWFKKGTRNGRANRNYKPIGTERICKDGYIERKIHDGMPLQSRWRAVHLIRWEEFNGPLPEGHCLKCLDGDRTNTDPGNWIAIPRALLPRLSGRWRIPYDSAPPEIKSVLLKIAQLEHAARAAREGKEQ
ncbi:HNH endonuclease [Sediminimonas qiaohouensis]|uniref:HNH endonuclease n=1 Tax=Sediminimonas qiaohouensis TaxID=552061 RepID=UPI0003FDD798|nr:HNH endonuclease [Sediminimonas qiaohouensis]